MDFNKFIEKCREKYSKNGVTSILLSVDRDDCHILLCGKNNYDENSDVEFIGITREEVNNTSVVYADIHIKMPLVEKKVFEVIDTWFDRASKAPPVIVRGINGDLPTRINPDFKVTTNKK